MNADIDCFVASFSKTFLLLLLRTQDHIAMDAIEYRLASTQLKGIFGFKLYQPLKVFSFIFRLALKEFQPREEYPAPVMLHAITLCNIFVSTFVYLVHMLNLKFCLSVFRKKMNDLID